MEVATVIEVGHVCVRRMSINWNAARDLMAARELGLETVGFKDG